MNEQIEKVITLIDRALGLQTGMVVTECLLKADKILRDLAAEPEQPQEPDCCIACDGYESGDCTPCPKYPIRKKAMMKPEQPCKTCGGDKYVCIKWADEDGEHHVSGPCRICQEPKAELSKNKINECPKCNRIALEWSGRAKVFECKYLDCDYVYRPQAKPKCDCPGIFGSHTTDCPMSKKWNQVKPKKRPVDCSKCDGWGWLPQDDSREYQRNCPECNPQVSPQAEPKKGPYCECTHCEHQDTQVGCRLMQCNYKHKKAEPKDKCRYCRDTGFVACGIAGGDMPCPRCAVGAEPKDEAGEFVRRTSPDFPQTKADTIQYVCDCHLEIDRLEAENKSAKASLDRHQRDAKFWSGVAKKVKLTVCNLEAELADKDELIFAYDQTRTPIDPAYTKLRAELADVRASWLSDNEWSREQEKKLRAELAEAKKIKQEYEETVQSAAALLKIKDKTIEELRAKLLEYGDHKDSCKAKKFPDRWDCTCGLKEAMKG